MFLSCGGPGAGSWLAALPTSPEVVLADPAMRFAVLFRLGLVSAPAAAKCQRRARDAAPCGAPLWPEPLCHMWACRKGGAVQHAHDAVRVALQACVSEVVSGVRAEVAVPSWSRRQQDGSVLEARLDLVVPSTPAGPAAWVDVSVRHAGAPSYRGSACRTPGAAAAAGVREKQARYPPLGHLRVTPFVLETGGRWSPEAASFLRRLASAAPVPAIPVEERDPVLSRLERWRARIGAALQRAVYAAYLDMFEMAPSQPPSPPDLGEP